jgi:hypothetical protein
VGEKEWEEPSEFFVREDSFNFYFSPRLYNKSVPLAGLGKTASRLYVQHSKDRKLKIIEHMEGGWKKSIFRDDSRKGLFAGRREIENSLYYFGY